MTPITPRGLRRTVLNCSREQRRHPRCSLYTAAATEPMVGLHGLLPPLGKPRITGACEVPRGITTIPTLATLALALKRRAPRSPGGVPTAGRRGRALHAVTSGPQAARCGVHRPRFPAAPHPASTCTPTGVMQLTPLRGLNLGVCPPANARPPRSCRLFFPQRAGGGSPIGWYLSCAHGRLASHARSGAADTPALGFRIHPDRNDFDTDNPIALVAREDNLDGRAHAARPVARPGGLLRAGRACSGRGNYDGSTTVRKVSETRRRRVRVRPA
jgi:hypothetical protein